MMTWNVSIVRSLRSSDSSELGGVGKFSLGTSSDSIVISPTVASTLLKLHVIFKKCSCHDKAGEKWEEAGEVRLKSHVVLLL